MEPSELDLIEDWFSYHAPTDHQRRLLEDARAGFKHLACWLVSNIANSRERAIALTELRKVAMVVNMAIIFSRDE